MENLSLDDRPPPSSPQRQGQGQGPAPQNQNQNAVFAGVPPQGAPQLPPQMFTTAAQLLDLTDKKLLLVLRDGRKIFGVLRSWDQFANLVLTDTRERYFVSIPAGTSPDAISATASQDAPSLSANTSLSTATLPRNLYCDIPRGTYLVRGENVLLLGEVDLDREDDPPPGYELGDVEEVFRLQRAIDLEKKRKDKIRARKVGQLWGGEIEGSGEVLF
ncbi:hypothetical protein HRR83_003633 [Exophiala dermatitidis]|uniref:U6 snRNA-associated Sm-like protein LSm1 n=2 Tax=Exophiala dermatitidis TaxID=5970 RepID=H6BSX8_EXODN|nr:uncharacterized protein HMPREF1120_01620 [Exophiala dermatitidis NIH/UT8656]KAJ4519057.1 hypothetical protein HRR75_002735 [Exophiala dermatitidis]EHY53427.1 hypothetical protein HMPREF1120_01620 [Exophiala dermatitidis NIH/UT8656]KAJ4522402.1 hypothetical protein HRR74_002987 [Exophiala dermatitidis]KAJ4529727.1 hypothetical protein HRR73_000755 [Exophiala dermatitidis]KAJ4543107.1 hypothetical protein HRR77_005366 [Exophiala dermatitidis]